MPEISPPEPAVDSAEQLAGDPRWLDGEEQQLWINFARMLFRLPSALDAQLQRDSGISYFEYTVLAVLSESPERTMRMSDLGAMADSMLPRLSQVVTRLEKRSWIQRSADPEDGRYTLATLTEAGFEKVVASAPGHVETVRTAVLDPLTKAQRKQLKEITRRVSAALEGDGC